VNFWLVTKDYFSAAAILFWRADHSMCATPPNAPAVAMINEALAKRYFHNEGSHRKIHSHTQCNERRRLASAWRWRFRRTVFGMVCAREWRWSLSESHKWLLTTDQSKIVNETS